MGRTKAVAKKSKPAPKKKAQSKEPATKKGCSKKKVVERGSRMMMRRMKVKGDKRILEGSDTHAMVVAAQCLGKLATPGGALTAELVEAEVKHALEWLTSERNENRRFAAVLILRELHGLMLLSLFRMLRRNGIKSLLKRRSQFKKKDFIWMQFWTLLC